MRYLVFILFHFICVYSVYSGENETTTQESLSSTTVISTTPAADNNTNCELHNGDCAKCVKESDCVYCDTNNECYSFGMEALLPDKKCEIKKRHVGTCKMNLMVVMILVGVAAGIVIIGVICCCCCCCKRNGKIKLSKEDLKWARQREERKKRTEQQREERAAKTEEIRRKYGLFKDDTPYQRFDA